MPINKSKAMQGILIYVHYNREKYLEDCMINLVTICYRKCIIDIINYSTEK